MAEPVSFLDGKVVLHPGDCLDVLARLPEASIDACVCDPPYHFTSIVKRFGKAGSAAAKSDGATGVFGRSSAGFMGKEWDGGDIAFRPETWRAVLRVLKPGAHLVAFGAPKNTGLLQHAIEGAGFETRDVILDLFDLDERARAFLATLNDAQRAELFALMDHATFGGLLAWVFLSGFPKSHDVAKAIDKARGEDLEPVRVVCRFVRAAMDRRGLKSRDLTGHFGGCNARLIDHWAARDTDSQPALPTPAQWAVLKSVLDLGEDLDAEVARLNARKGQPGDTWQGAEVLGEHAGAPGGFGDLRFSVRDSKIRELSEAARRWSGWGTAMKPAFEPIVLARKPVAGTIAENVLRYGTGGLNVDACAIHLPDGPRWPADLVHDGSDAVRAAFPADERGDDGSRIFYSPKADSDTRIGSKHPTVKPVDLMRWLVRLVTPAGGLVLDPFGGTGTTGEAAFREGMRAILCEREPEYQADIARRMQLCLAGPAIRRAESARARARPGAPLDLFGDMQP